MTGAFRRFTSRNRSFVRIGGAYVFAGALAASLLAASALSIPARAGGEGQPAAPVVNPPPAETPKIAAPCPPTEAKKIQKLKDRIEKNSERIASLDDKIKDREAELKNPALTASDRFHLQSNNNSNTVTKQSLEDENRRLEREIAQIRNYDKGC
jgi:TolA-binding protein